MAHPSPHPYPGRLLGDLLAAPRLSRCPTGEGGQASKRGQGGGCRAGPGRGEKINLGGSPASRSPSLSGLICDMETMAALPMPKESFEVMGNCMVLSKCEVSLLSGSSHLRGGH